MPVRHKDCHHTHSQRKRWNRQNWQASCAIPECALGSTLEHYVQGVTSKCGLKSFGILGENSFETELCRLFMPRLRKHVGNIMRQWSFGASWPRWILAMVCGKSVCCHKQESPWQMLFPRTIAICKHVLSGMGIGLLVDTGQEKQSLENVWWSWWEIVFLSSRREYSDVESIFEVLRLAMTRKDCFGGCAWNSLVSL